MAGLLEALCCRTIFIDKQLTQSINEGVRQIVILGAGYDTRF